MDPTTAVTVLERFDSVIKTVARNVAETFPTITEAEDVEQEASILVMSYAGLVPNGRLAGKLYEWETMTDKDEKQVTRLVNNQLRMDLSQMYGREADKREATYSMDAIPESYLPPAFDLTDTLSQEANFRKHYPTLAFWLVDDMTQEQISDFASVSIATVERRIAKEKRTYLEHYARRGGLRVEGDESLAELQEACGHLKAVGR